MANKAEKLLIIGGSDAGVSAALKAKELKPELEVQVLLADEYPNLSICVYLMQSVVRYLIGNHWLIAV